MRTWFPNIQIGAIASSDPFFTRTNPLLVDDHLRFCFRYGIQDRTINDWNELLNSTVDINARRQGEMLKSLVRLAAFSGEDEKPESTNAIISERCSRGFDFLYVEVEYWSTIQFPDPILDQLPAYENFKNCLNLAQLLKCKYTCLRSIDAEFNPSSFIGVSKFQQIQECDFLIDRPTIPSYVRPQNAGLTFDWKCDTYRLMADPSTKKHSKIFVQLSAEKIGFVDCHTNIGGNDFLGAYLDGSATPNGNMYSVEKDFVSKLEDQSYVCPNCNCTTFRDNHFYASAQDANEIVGSVWFAYSFMNTYNLLRKQKDDQNNVLSSQSLIVSPIPSSDWINISLSDENIEIKNISVYDGISHTAISLEKPVKDYKLDVNQFENGAYILKIQTSENTILTGKIIIAK
jgi:hypothetical protein